MKATAILTVMLSVCVVLANIGHQRGVSAENVRTARAQKIEKRKVVEEIVRSIPVITSAYYSPRPDQGFYATGSYEGDIRLNGKGKKTKYARLAPHEGTVATDPDIIPPGTRFRMYDPKLPKEKRVYHYAVAEDGGGDIHRNRVDVYMGKGEKNLRKALHWGKKPMIAQIVKRKEVIILASR